MTWSQFRKAHGSVRTAADFFTIEAWMMQLGKNLTEPVDDPLHQQGRLAVIR